MQEVKNAEPQRDAETDLQGLEAHLERRQMGAHHCGERSRGKETTAEENGLNGKNTRYSSKRAGYVSSRSKETAHGGKKSMVQVVKETSLLGPLKKLEGQIATAVVGATLLFGCEVRGFSKKEEREYEVLWSRVVFGITRQKNEDNLNKQKKRWLIFVLCAE